MNDKPPADVPRKSVRVITGLDDGAITGLRARVAAGRVGDASDEVVQGAVKPLIDILMWPRVKAAQVVELTVVTKAEVLDVVGPLRDALVELIPHPVDLEVRMVTVTGPVGGAIGDHPEFFATGTTSLTAAAAFREDKNSPSAGPSTGEAPGQQPAVFVNGLCGTADLRRALCATADAWGAPVLLSADEHIYARRPLGELTSSVLLGALRFALTTTWSPERDVELLSRGFDGLVTRNGDSARYRATRTLDHLLADDRFIGLPDHFSACADLLERHNEPKLADNLRQLIDHWLRHRIWSINYVHEMVLHDEAHSVTVDRNVASLCEPLLNAPVPVIKLWDVFVLALAAWLHDWGHASADVGGQTPTDPVEVRHYHGLLTALRLEQEPDQHGITDALIPGFVEGDEVTHVLESEVALLCSHHQGWTSCSDTPPVDDFEPLPDFSIINGATFDGSSDQGIAGELGLGLSFRDDYARRLGANGASCGRDVEQMYRLVTLLRIADAADIGAHRVPDFATQHTNRTAALDSLLAQISLVLTLRSSVAARVSDRELAYQADATAFRAVERAYDHLLGRATSQAFWADNEFERIIAKVMKDKNLGHWMQPTRATDTPGHQLVRWAWIYATHVANQVAFYQVHRRVRGVIPTLLPNSSWFELTLHVVPLAMSDPDGRAVDPTQVATSVRKDVLREFAGAGENDKAHKAQLANHMSRLLRIDTSVVHTVHYTPEFTNVGKEPETPPLAPTTALPFARGASTAWLSIGPQGGVVSEPLVTGPPAPAGFRVLSSTPDGRYIATCVESKVVVFRASDMSRAHEYRVDPEWSGATVLAIVAVRAGFRAVLTRAGRTASIDLASGYTHAKSATPETECPVRAISLSPGLRLVDATGTYTGADADLLSDGGRRWSAFDLIAHESGYLLVTVISSARAVRVRHLSQDVRNDSLHEVRRLPDIPLADEPIDALWVRGLDSALPPQLAITTLGGTLVHAVAGLR